MKKRKEWRGARPRVVACLRLGLMAFLLFSLAPAIDAQTTTNRVLDLDGTNSYVELGPDIFTNLTDATVEGWVKWRTDRKSVV